MKFIASVLSAALLLAANVAHAANTGAEQGHGLRVAGTAVQSGYGRLRLTTVLLHGEDVQLGYSRSR